MSSEQQIGAQGWMREQEGIRLGKGRLSLFRAEALSRHSNQLYGATVIATPLSFFAYAVVALSLIVALVAYLALGTYAKSETVKAVIKPINGVTKILAKNDGIVLERYVEEGQRIAAGDPLFTVGDGMGRDRNNGPQEKTIMYAPVDGTVYQLNLHPGNTFYELQELGQIAAGGPLVVKVEVSSESRATIAKGMRLDLELDGEKNRPSAKLKGIVKSVSMGPAEQVRQFGENVEYKYPAVAIIDLSSTKYRPSELLGKTVDVKIPQEGRKLYKWLLDPARYLFNQ